MVMNILYRFKCIGSSVHESGRRAISYQIEHLHRRAFVKLSGDDIVPYIQGLITNDVYHLDNGGGAIFTHFLNNKGRILYDAFLCKRSQNELLLECDTSMKDEIVRHLKMYRVRKKVDIEPSDGHVWSIFDETIPSSNIGTWSCENDDSNSNYSKIASALCSKNVLAFQDPRIPSLGVRIYALPSENLMKVLYQCEIPVIESKDYVVLRYKLGVPEGVSEIPVGKCFPMEMNCDYLNGVSFHKGCYIGQELTARTHHTGVVRKRIMPLILSSVPDKEIDYDSVIATKNDQVVGKLKGIHQNYCIALLRTSETLKNPSNLNLNGIAASTYKPFWWPSKEKDLSEDSAS